MYKTPLKHLLIDVVATKDLNLAIYTDTILVHVQYGRSRQDESAFSLFLCAATFQGLLLLVENNL